MSQSQRQECYRNKSPIQIHQGDRTKQQSNLGRLSRLPVTRNTWIDWPHYLQKQYESLWCWTARVAASDVTWRVPNFIITRANYNGWVIDAFLNMMLGVYNCKVIMLLQNTHKNGISQVRNLLKKCMTYLLVSIFFIQPGRIPGE